MPLVNALLNRYLAIAPMAQQLQQAKTWYRQQLEVRIKTKPNSQEIIPPKILSDIPYVERNARWALIDYHTTLIKPSVLDVLVLSNMTPIGPKRWCVD